MLKQTALIILMTSSLFFSGCNLLIRDPEKAYKKGVEAINQKKPEKAYKYFLLATKKAPDNATYHWAAAQTAQNQNAAFIHTELAWESGLKTVPVMVSLMRLSLFTEKGQRITKMLSLYSELPDTIKTPMLKAELFSQLGIPDSALAIWKKMYSSKPTQVLAFRIGRELNQLNKLEEARDFLEKARKAKQLDGAGYVLLASLRAYEYDYEGVNEIFKETRSLGLYSNEVALEEAAFFFVSNKYDEAGRILREYRTPNPDQKDQFINHRARINLAFLFAAKGQHDSINVLSSEVPDSTPFRKGEQRFYTLLLKGDTTNSELLLKELDEIRKIVPSNPFIELYTARALLKSGQSAKAVEIYKRLPGIYVRSPGILTEYALALTSSGKIDEALVAVSTMHRKKSFTRGSLELFRDLTFRKNLIDKSEHAQQLLEKLYGNDARVKWNGATLALRMGKVDSALVLLEDLEKQFPKEYQFRTARISALIVKGDYDKALALCNSGDIPQEHVIPLKTQILKKQGKDAEALQMVESAIKDKSMPQLQLLYAEMLIGMNRNSEAANVYEELLNSRNKETKEGPGTAAIYNNMAWAMLQSENPDKKVTLKAAQRAYELLPSSPNIIDTYAEVLLKFGDYSNCIKILEGSKLTQEEPKLTFHLAMAYEKKNDLNKAIRNFKTAIALMDSSSGTIKMDLSKAAVERHIDKLLQN